MSKMHIPDTIFSHEVLHGFAQLDLEVLTSPNKNPALAVDSLGTFAVIEAQRSDIDSDAPSEPHIVVPRFILHSQDPALSMDTPTPTDIQPDTIAQIHEIAALEQIPAENIDQAIAILHTYSNYLRMAVTKTANSLSNYDIENVFQDISIRVLRYIHTFRNGSDIKTWLYRVASNATNTYVKKEKRIRDRTDITPLEHHEITDLVPRSKHIERLELASTELINAIDSVQPEGKRLIYFLHLAGFTHAQIEKITGASNTNVKVSIHRANKKVRGQVEARAHDDVNEQRLAS